jgi:hypothetical protein
VTVQHNQMSIPENKNEVARITHSWTASACPP